MAPPTGLRVTRVATREQIRSQDTGRLTPRGAPAPPRIGVRRSALELQCSAVPRVGHLVESHAHAVPARPEPRPRRRARAPAAPFPKFGVSFLLYSALNPEFGSADKDRGACPSVGLADASERTTSATNASECAPASARASSDVSAAGGAGDSRFRRACSNATPAVAPNITPNAAPLKPAERAVVAHLRRPDGRPL